LAAPEVRAAPAVRRSPSTFLETLIANCRPQPAIPALLVLLLTLMFANSIGTQSAGTEANWLDWVVIGGIIASCGLAIAAGFCSLFPPLAWIAVVNLASGIIERGPGAPISYWVLLVCTVAAGLMILVQVWRVRTGRFVPTMGDDTTAG
jgi:hypothetical protein